MGFDPTSSGAVVGSMAGARVGLSPPVIPGLSVGICTNWSPQSATKVSTVNDVTEQIESAVPSKLFCSINRTCNSVICPISAGSCPVSAFCFRIKCRRVVSLPNPAGICWLKLLSSARASG